MLAGLAEHLLRIKRDNAAAQDVQLKQKVQAK
jgi:hypothetical protein